MFPNAYGIFQDAVKQEAFLSVAARLTGLTIVNATMSEDQLTLHLDNGTTVEYSPWASYADDSGVDLRVDGEEVPQQADYIGPFKPPMTPEQKTEYRASLGPFQRVMYDEMDRIARDLNRGLNLLTFTGDADELPESSS